MVVVLTSKIWVHSEPFLRLLLSPDNVMLQQASRDCLSERMVLNLLLLSSLALAYSPEEPLLFDSFPDDFIWGSATAAYQVILTPTKI